MSDIEDYEDYECSDDDAQSLSANGGELGEEIRRESGKSFAMGPYWREVYTKLHETLNLIPDSLVRLILDYYGLVPVIMDWTYHRDNLREGYPQFGYCSGCQGRVFDEVIAIIAYRGCKIHLDYHESPIASRQLPESACDEYRAYCNTCWTFDSKLIDANEKLKIDWTQPKKTKWDKVGDEDSLIACNDVTKMAFLCLDESWKFFY